ncbi:MAG: response regulator transcription factor [Chloroherpetonaceae bacterium]
MISLTTTETMTIRVAIVEDTASYRKAIASMLDQADDFECVAKFSSAEEAINQMIDHKPDVVLMDIGLPKMSGIEAIKALKSMMPSIRILMLTVIDDSEKIFSALQAGASGYLLKDTPPEKLLEAIRDVHSGGSAMSSQVARRVIAYFQQPAPPEEALDLTTRERELLDYLAKGYTYKEIGNKLFISEHTVRTHIHRIYEKLHVRNRTEALHKVFQNRR